METKLIPYTVYLPEEHFSKIKALAKERKASGVIRDALCSFLDGDDQYVSGYNKAIKESIKRVKANEELRSISIRNQTVSQKVSVILQSMEK